MPLHFPARSRLRKPAEFRAVYDARMRQRVGPLVVWSRPNGLPHPRLGLAVGRRVGNAVVRNGIKRRLREAFRLLQHELPPYDLVVSAHPHDTLTMSGYRELLREAARVAQAGWSRRDGCDRP